MAPKPRAAASKGARAGGKKAAKHTRTGSRNITRWSANKDITLLCALAKECRRAKFGPDWNNVAKWIGPNITGAAVEQHVAKLYSKLNQHRAATEPKPKRRKLSLDSDDDNPDYVKDEDSWGKGNEALANIFYDKPDHSGTRQAEDEVESGIDDVDNQEYMEGDPSGLILGGSRYLSTNYGEAEESFAPNFEEPISDMHALKHERSAADLAYGDNEEIDLMNLKTGKIGEGNQYNYGSYPMKAEAWQSPAAQNPYDMTPGYAPRPDMVPPAMMHRSQQNSLLQRQNTAAPIIPWQRLSNIVPYGIDLKRSASLAPDNRLNTTFHSNNMTVAPVHSGNNPQPLLEYRPLSRQSTKTSEERQPSKIFSPYGSPPSAFEPATGYGSQSFGNLLGNTFGNEQSFGDLLGNTFGNEQELRFDAEDVFYDQFLNQEPEVSEE